MSDEYGKSQTEVAIETFVDRMKEIHPDLDREEFHNAISGYVQNAVTESDGAEESSETDEES